MRRRWSVSGPVRKVFAAAVALAALVAPFSSGFGIQPTGIISAGDPAVAAGKAPTITVYLEREGRLVPVVRPGLPGRPFLGIIQLGVPVTLQERSKGLDTEVPRQTGMQVRHDGPPGFLTVDVAGAGVADGEPPPGRSWSRIALGQVACTAKAIPGVERVRLTGLLNRDRTAWVTVTCGGFDDLIGG